MKDRTLEWEKDVRFRTESFHEILNNGVNQDLILMIRCLHRKRQELVQLGKKLPARDSNTLKTAERLVEDVYKRQALGNAIGVSPVGCSIVAHQFMNVDMMESPHGRAPALSLIHI